MGPPGTGTRKTVWNIPVDAIILLEIGQILFAKLLGPCPLRRMLAGCYGCYRVWPSSFIYLGAGPDLI